MTKNAYFGQIGCFWTLNFRPWSTKQRTWSRPELWRNGRFYVLPKSGKLAENLFFVKKKSTQNLLKDWYLFWKMVLLSLVQTQTLNSLFWINTLSCPNQPAFTRTVKSRNRLCLRMRNLRYHEANQFVIMRMTIRVTLVGCPKKHIFLEFATKFLPELLIHT